MPIFRNCLADLKKDIKSFTLKAQEELAMKNRSDGEERGGAPIDEVHEIKLSIPEKDVKLFKLAKDKINFRIVDVPGVDDFYWTQEIRKYVRNHLDSILPVIIVDSSSGSITNLVQFDFLKQIFREFQDLELFVILTKLNSGRNNMAVEFSQKLVQEDDSLQELSDSDFLQFLLDSLSAKTFQGLKQELERDFKPLSRVRFFVFEKSQEDRGEIFADRRL